MQWRFKLKRDNRTSDRMYCDIVNNDKRGFLALEEGRITREVCLKEFRENNKIKDEIPMEEFITWLRGLGWNV